ncbi:MAG: beta-lactamase family protein [Bacteriovoracaceae bacterium]|nr:beta-lactamase family protein [Bacteriovoracaceae bacterium]
MFTTESEKYKEKATLLQEIINSGDSKTLFENLSPGFQKGFPRPMVSSFLGRITGYCGRLLELDEGIEEDGKYSYYPKFSTNKCFLRFSLNSDGQFNYLLIDRHKESVSKLRLDPDLDFVKKVKLISSHYFKNTQMHGLAVGVIDNNNVKFYFFGNGGEKDIVLNGDSLFQLGSLTKVYTALLAHKLQKEGKIDLNNQITDSFPKRNYRFLYKKKKVAPKLHQLLNHTSGLPSLPLNLKGPALNPYSRYSFKKLYRGMSKVYLTSLPGNKFNYSNWGVTIAGQHMAKKLNTSFSLLLKNEILDEIGLSDTSMDKSSYENLVFGYDGKIRRDPWVTGVFDPAGGLISSIRDQVKFMQYSMKNIENKDHWIHETFVMSKAINSHNAVASGWMIRELKKRRIYWHNGGTGTFSSFLGFDKKGTRGVVLLSNSSNVPVTELGFKILDEN